MSGAEQDSKTDPADRLAARIDHWIENGWKKNKVAPAPSADDAEFMRRVYLDLSGRIPSVSEARQFLKDKNPEKRRALVENLLQGPGYLRHFTNVWRRVYLPELQTTPQFGLVTAGFDTWLREQLVRNAPYDQTVRELLTGSLTGDPRGSSATQLFVQVKEQKPENIAAGVSRSLLGVRLECAQCHNHPFAKWKQEEFWGFAAFFQELQPGTEKNTSAKAELTIPGKNKVVEARYLESDQGVKAGGTSARVQVADWIVSRQNRFFARATVNRVWGTMFGKGIVDPVDDFDEANPPSHPELLDELASAFAEQGFDLKFLLRAITRSRTYQVSSLQTDPSQENLRLFGRMGTRPLSVDQLFDALSQATGYYEPFVEENNFGMETPRMKIRQLFQNESATGEAQTSILQALALMNGEFVTDATDLEKSRTLAGIVESPFLSPSEKIEACYLATLSRLPREQEQTFLLKSVEQANEATRKAVYTDLFWALLNSSEFVLQH
ncbi:MAG: DUF1549 and DUF1553 domain-containing protein [Planctomycetales bacterium]